MEDEKVYVFKVALKQGKIRWFHIEIMGNQTLGDFDYIMRETFNHDTWDHLSEFFGSLVIRVARTSTLPH